METTLFDASIMVGDWNFRTRLAGDVDDFLQKCTFSSGLLVFIKINQNFLRMLSKWYLPESVQNRRYDFFVELCQNLYFVQVMIAVSFVQELIKYHSKFNLLC